MMHHHFQVFMSLRLILFLLTTYGYMILVVAHIYGLICRVRNSRKLTKGEPDLRVGNGARVVVSALWTYVLNLPSDLCLNLEDCCYVLALTRNIIFGFMFEQENFYFYFVIMVVTLSCLLCWWYIKQ